LVVHMIFSSSASLARATSEHLLLRLVG
jgi:hypothetical protein